MKRWALKITAGLVAVLVLAEIGLRVHQTNFLDGPAQVRAKYVQKVRLRLFGHFMNRDQKDPFIPPYVVYSDRGFDDEDRLQEIFEATKLPASSEWKSYDFIQPEAWRERTSYTIRSNSLGFRDSERSKRKPKGTYRVIALGSYHVFGHGVEGEEAYPAQLEKRLNESSSDGRRYEVWNGGRNTGTAIIGLSRMKHEIFEYDPDLLILDYGFVDPLVWSDNLMLSAMSLPETGAWAWIKEFSRPILLLLPNSTLFNRMMDWIVRTHYRKNVEAFSGTMGAMLKMARDRGIPVILVRQMTARVSQKVYLDLTDQGARLVDVIDIFVRNVPSFEERFAFMSTSVWTNEIEGLAEDIARAFPYAPYQVDGLQLNAAGHAILGEALVETVREVERSARPK